MKKFLWGLAGAIVGAVTALVATMCAVAFVSGGNSLGAGFLFAFLAPFGLVVGIVAGAIAGNRLHRHIGGKLASASLRAKGWYAARITASVLAIDLTIGYAALHTNDPPPDQVLLANFERHEADFDKIVARIQQERNLPHLSEDDNGAENAPVASTDRANVASYRRLLREAGLPKGFHTDEQYRNISFPCFVTGSAISSCQEKGYLYTSTPPQPGIGFSGIVDVA